MSRIPQTNLVFSIASLRDQHSGVRYTRTEAEYTVIETEAAGLRAELEDKDVEIAVLNSRITDLGAKVTDLENRLEISLEEIANPRDVRLKMITNKLTKAQSIHAELKRTNNRLRLELTKSGTQTNSTTVEPSGVQYQVSIPRLEYPSILTHIGHTEVVFSGYINANRLKHNIAEFVMGGRVTGAFFSKCFVAMSPSQQWYGTFFNPPHRGNGVDYFFWKIEVLNLREQLIALLLSYDGFIAISSKTHITNKQINTVELGYKYQKRNFEFAVETEYLARPHLEPSIEEYSRTVVATSVQLWQSKVAKKDIILLSDKPTSNLVDFTGGNQLNITTSDTTKRKRTT